MTELMVAAGIAAILLAVAMPSFQRTIQNNRITASTNKLVGDLRLARSEAMKRAQRVVMCRSADPTAVTPACGGTTNTWTNGWIIFANADTNTTFDNGIDTLLRVGEAQNTGQLTIVTNSAGDADVVFNPDASTNESGNTLRWAVCDNRGASYGKLIEVPPSGRARLTSATNCSTPS